MEWKRSVTLAIVSLLLTSSCTLIPPPEEEPTATPTQDLGALTAIPTSTSLPTETALPATATFTYAPTKTATPLPTHTATSTSLPSPTTPPPSSTPPPSPTPTPVLEPITLRISGLETRQETVEAHRRVIAEWSWAVCNSDVLTENLDAITFEVTVDGTVVATGNLAEHRSAVREEDRDDGLHVWVTYWTYPMGAFASGSFHWLEVEWHLSRAVTDGCDSDRDGHLDVYGPGVHGVQRLEVTVQ